MATSNVPLDDAQKLVQFQKRIDVLKQKRASAEAEERLLRQQFDAKVEEAKKIGVTDINALPELIEVLNSQIEAERVALEVEITNLEQSVASAGQ